MFTSASRQTKHTACLHIPTEPAAMVYCGQGMFEIPRLGGFGMEICTRDALIPSPSVLFEERLHDA